VEIGPQDASSLLFWGSRVAVFDTGLFSPSRGMQLNVVSWSGSRPCYILSMGKTWNWHIAHLFRRRRLDTAMLAMGGPDPGEIAIQKSRPLSLRVF